MKKTVLKKSLTLAALLLSLLFLPAARADESGAEKLWDKANRLYAQEEYEDALAAYGQIQVQGLNAPQLLYNMGNAAFRLGRSGLARALYERALKNGMAHDEDLRINLNFLLSTLKDPEVMQKRNWRQAAAHALGARTWLWSGISCYCIIFLLAALGLALRGRLSAAFRSAMALFAAAALLCMLALMEQRARPENFAVVRAPSANVMHTPSYTGKTFFTLHEGAKLRLLQQDGNWAFVQYGKDSRGWIEAEGIIRI